MACKHYKKVPSWYGSSPKCGFYKTGKFNKNNWNCKLLNDLRNLVLKEDICVWANDQNLSITTFKNGFWYKHNCYSHMLISIYKSRGNVSGIWFLSDGFMIKSTEEMIKKAIKEIIKEGL